MRKIVNRKDKIIINYSQSKGGKQRSFNLVFPYINDTEIDVVLVAEESDSGEWNPLKAFIDKEETTADEEEAAKDLADLTWHIYSRKERKKLLPPVVNLWEEGNLIIAACLSEKYGEKFFTAKQQENLEKEVLNSDRLICWWPDPVIWESAKKLKESFNLLPFNEIAVPFYTFKEYFKRPDIQAEMQKYWDELEEISESPQEFAVIGKNIKVDEYAKYLRGLKTTLLFLKKNNIPFKLTLGNVDQAEEFFKKENLDPFQLDSWIIAAPIFEPMSDFLIEEQILTGPSSVITGKEEIKACLSFLSHFPYTAPVPDAIGAVVYAGDKHISSTVFWFNPATTIEIVNKTMEEALEELNKRGAEKIIMIEEMVPFETSWEGEGLLLQIPEGW
ncbi:hypothetical protein TheetDRAFT_1280 [Thermoanaerobacter ethanolicus JW 200]|uniref:hypothetical protein n=1 Tax=Thermoanaerobacter ethanolicus TaxID=1757 RepID=UPI000202C7E0|nr:hypothetical protein TheetDRAFT_1280 [Thermoanaerobacter ethanolicus JW 200]